MPVIVNTNVQSLIAQRNLNSATNSLNTATQRLSTGLRINKAGDDAAGLFISKGLESQLRGAQQCQTNIGLANNVLQIAEGDLGSIQDNVMRIKDLATQAANGIYSTDARSAMIQEVTARLDEINRVAMCSNFNGMHLLDGSDTTLSNLRIQVGPNSDPTGNALTIKNVFVDSKATALGLFLTGGKGTATTTINTVFKTASAAAQYIQTCADTLNNLSSKRAAIGAIQSRLQMTSDGLATSIENLSAAKSTIMDTDIAATTADYTRAQILQNISASMLTQANMAPQVALSLLPR